MTFENTPINISVTFRHTEPTEALKSYITEKLTHILQKYMRYQTEVKVVLSVEKRDHNAEVILHSKGYDISGSATTTDLYSAIDKVVDNINAQLRRQKERTVDRYRHQAAH